jgi:pSer/pThr/pTyr-binding forkhead associated (FHA) protein
VIVGRNADCQVFLAESSVSRQQCKIYLNGAVIIENLSNSNRTQLNGLPLNNPTILKLGDKIKCGRTTLIVDALNVSDSHSAGDLNKFTQFVNI